MKKLLLIALMGLSVRAYADTKISAFTSTTTLNVVDIIPVVTNPSSSPANRSITKTNLASTLDILTQSSATATYLQNSSATVTYAPISGSSNYIRNTSTLQSGATVYTSSGTINVFNTNSTSTLKYTEIGNLTHSQKIKMFSTDLPISGGFGPQVVYHNIIADGMGSDAGYLAIVASTYTTTNPAVGIDSLAGITISPPGGLSGGNFNMCSSSYTCVEISQTAATVGSPLTFGIDSLTNALVATNASGVLVSTTVNLGASNVGGILPVSNGGTGTATPSITAGTNITSVTGTWPNVTINAATQAGSGGSSSLEVMVDGVRLSSPTATVSLIAGSNITLTPSLVGGTTAQITIAATGGGGISLTDLSATQPILYNNATGAFSATPISLSTGAVGTLQAAQMPALTGDITTAGASLATTLASITTANQYGSSTVVPIITYDAKGRITAVSSATITGGSGDAVLSATQTFSGANTFSSTVNISSVATITALVLGTTSFVHSSSSTITPDATMGNNISITLTSSATINVPINAQDFEMFRYRIIQDGAGSRNVILGSGFAFGTDVSSATFSTAASKVDYLSCIFYASSQKCHIVAPVIRGY